MLPVLLAASPAAAPVLRPQEVRALPGGLDGVLMLNDNNPELISGPGILLSTFGGSGHLDVPLSGRFDLFSHHVYAGTPEQPDSTMWLAVVAQPRGDEPVQLSLLSGSTALSQATDGREAQAPFLPLPERMRRTAPPMPVQAVGSPQNCSCASATLTYPNAGPWPLALRPPCCCCPFPCRASIPC